MSFDRRLQGRVLSRREAQGALPESAKWMRAELTDTKCPDEATLRRANLDIAAMRSAGQP